VNVAWKAAAIIDASIAFDDGCNTDEMDESVDPSVASEEEMPFSGSP